MSATATTTGTHDHLHLPILNMEEYRNENTRPHFLKTLRHLAKDIGFFYVIGHGIPTEDREEMLNEAKKFFALPPDVKDKVNINNSPHFRGYTKTGDERTRNKPDYREQLDIGEELETPPGGPRDDTSFENKNYDAAASDAAQDPNPLWLNLIGPNQWPAEVPELKPKALQYQQRVRALGIELLHAFLGALEVPEDALDCLVTGTPQSYLKIVHYPENDEASNPHRMQGCGPHKDIGLLTLLWQDDSGGLEVLTKEGEVDEAGNNNKNRSERDRQKGEGRWVPAPPIKGSYVVNIGESLELATNGYLRANIHRVVRPVSAKGSRYSIPFFLTENVRVASIPLVPLKEEIATQARGPASDPLNPMFQGVGKNLLKARLRSHLPVTKRFYPKQYAALEAQGLTVESGKGNAY